MLDGDPTVAEIAAEQAYVGRLYGQLDVLRVATDAALKSVIGTPTTGTPASRSEREAFVSLYSQRLAQLYAVESRLCFGRLDLVDGQRRYVGRIGLSDEQRNELLVDWRAPAAEPFYQATAARPLDVLRRRQLSTAGRTVSGVQDEVLDLAAFEEQGVDGSHVVLGEGALFASLDVVRSGRMRDIVATIQADQDRAIRAPLDGVLVVQGGPGTGKTAVALHRTAFLLYANRERIARSGVLLVGPNRVFLQYIEQVLPTLGETEAVVMATPGELFPGVETEVVDEPKLAALKGDLRMVTVIAAAVRDRERTIDRSRRLNVDGTTVTLDPAPVRQARDRARRTGAPHNEARVGFVGEIMRGLVRQLAAVRGTELDPESRNDLMALLFESPDVRREINWCWAPISPQRLLRDLYANPSYLEPAARVLSAAERRLLHRDRSAPWTVADVALLDEAAELLGAEDGGTRGNTERRADAERRAEAQYADLVQDTFGGQSFVSAEELARRYTGTGSLGSVAERAANDRSWVYGHVVVDEAQELSAMAWRVLMRRVPSRSLTIVGDIAQTGSAAGATSWAQVLKPHVDGRWQLAELTVNYRTPSQIMELAGAVVHAGGLSVRVPTSARVGRTDPLYTVVADDAASAPELAKVARLELDAAAGGTVVVITSASSQLRASANVRAAIGDNELLSVLTVREAKGLEFDGVIVLEPGEIVAESARGLNDLYVGLTRATQRLHIVHANALPAGLEV
jgi:DNA helicase IV